MIRSKSILGAVSILAMVGVAGCSSSAVSSSSKASAHAQTVTPILHVVTDAKTQIAAGSIVGIEGSYVGCTGTPSQWVLDTAGNAGQMETAYPGLAAPQVDLNDTNCTLEIDGISTGGVAAYTSTGQTSTGATEQLDFTGTAETGIVVNQYLPSSVAFDNGGTLAFYANAQSTVIDATANFGLTLLISADPTTASGGVTAVVSTITGSLNSASNVPAPDYGVDTSGVTLNDDVNCIVTSSLAGNVTLTGPTSTAGQNYQVFQAPDMTGDTFAQLDANWNANTANNVAISGGGPVSVPVTSLISVGSSMATAFTANIVVQNLDAASQVPSYEVILVTFTASHGCGG
jgi:hypothetical protein